MTQPIEKPGFTLRAAIIAVALSLFLLMSTSYIALKLGIVPWPIIFAVVFSGGLLRLLRGSGKLNIHEVNVAQAGASIGGLVAAGIAFTVPGILLLNQTKALDIAWPTPWKLGLLTAIAGLLGILLSVPLKYTFVDEEKLPYPAGTAGAELLKLGKTGGRELFFIMIIGCLAAMFALLRDVFFPTGFSISKLQGFGIFLTILPIPLFVSSGYILGPKASFSWFAGAAVGWLLIVPLLYHNGNNFDASKAFVQNLGMGMVLGSGVAFFISYVLPRIKKIFAPIFKSQERVLKIFPVVALFAFLILYFSKVPLLAAALSLLGVWMMVTVAARMTGETNIDPLEQFGIFIGLMIALVYKIVSIEITMFALFMIVTFVSVACAVAGDAGHDYKSSVIIGTRFFDIVKVDIIAVIVCGLAAPFVIEIIRKGFSESLFTEVMPAPQAQMVAGSIFGFEYPKVFAFGFALAFLGEICSRFIPKKFQNKLLIMPFGIGLFLGLSLAIPLAIGGLIRSYIDKNRSDLYYPGLLIAAGIMGGEGIAGFSAGGLTVLGMSFKNGAILLFGLFLILSLISFIFYLKGEKEI